MTPDEARVKALELAVEHARANAHHGWAPDDLVKIAEQFRQFLDPPPGFYAATSVPPYPGPLVAPSRGTVSNTGVQGRGGYAPPQPTQQDPNDPNVPVASRREWYHP